MNGEIRDEISVTQRDDYSDALEKVFNEVKDREEGVLYTCIKELAPANADKISQYFNVSDRASLKDDLQVLGQIPSFRPILERMDQLAMIKNISPLKGLIEMTTMGVTSLLNRNFVIGSILLISLVLLGYWSAIVGKKKNNKRGDQRKNGGRTLASEAHPASLCLVIPCNRIAQSLQDSLSRNELSSSETAILIDESVYFLATASAESCSPTIQRDDGWKDFPEGSDLFVQLHIPDGGELLTADLKWSLSQAVSAKEQFIDIKKIGLRQDFNNLEKFHRA